MGRWDHLHDAKPLELRAFVLDQVADQLVAELRAWPPRTEEWTDPREEERFRPVLTRATRPDLEAFRVGLELARLDLLHELTRIDRFWDSPEMHTLLPDPLEQASAQFIWRWLIESALEFNDWSQGKFRRRDLVALIEKIEDRMLRGLRLRLDEPASA